MGLLKLRKNKKFSYTPRYYKGEGNPYEITHKFDEHRTTVGSNSGLKTKFNNALEDYKNPDKKANRRILIIVGILILVFLFIIDFDLSIFFSK
ncbi:riboflavin synthase subunit beta [Jejuia spongiicola]|uniref:Riboflavin synthase subunit beta n=1 Tax=Jejuia spongiicola TaxID=2942207 RepID=A0ABT0QK21_9FLAO|nr:MULTISPECIES: riboflavin synthase subunit beta [Flavobacteriaceae]MCL6296614.1 riboflavin synthase subunit beta [Jejuia spongiicola]PIA80726.1 riboflavin synthase subunit beta [Gaetbulibacter sp. 4G1]